MPHAKPRLGLVAPIALVALLAVGPVATAQQGHAGRYAVSGTDAALGAYQGELSLTPAGSHYEAVRKVRFAASPPGGPLAQPLTWVWWGTATAQGGALHVTFPLRRMDWVTEAGGLARTAADQVPDVVTGTYAASGAGALSATLTSPGGLAAADTIVWSGPLGAAGPLTDERVRVPAHAAPPAWLRTIFFAMFSDYQQLPYVAPFVHRPEFQAAVHMELRDRTGFAWLRANPGELLLLNKRADAIGLAEAELRRAAYGQRLHEKAAAFDRDAEGRHLDDPGLLAMGVRPDPAVPGALQKVEDMSTALWSACYLYAQACRYQVTGEAQALTNVERLAAVFCDLVEIDTRPGEFARSLRPIGRAPLGGSWHAGSGPFAHLAFHDNGNNDMVKGLWLAFFAAWDVLPANHPLRPRIEACVREIADLWSSSPHTAGNSGNRRNSPKNQLVTNMLAFWVTGEARYEDAYRRALRSPVLLAQLATGGTFQAYGVADWSGTHLGVVSSIAAIELGRRLGSSWVPLYEHGLRMQHRFVRKYRATMFSVAVASFMGDASAADEALWGLREFPYPKPMHAVDRALDPSYCISPYPGLPWKLDWMTNRGRTQSLYHYPIFMRRGGNYYWRSGPLDSGGDASAWEHHGADYLFAYWLARKGNVFSGSE